MTKNFGIVTMLWLGVIWPAFGANIAECGPLKGYKLEQGVNGWKTGGWEDVGSTLVLSRQAPGKFDVLIANESSKAQSSVTKEGVTIKLIHTARHYMSFLLSKQDGQLQSLVFFQSKSGKSQVLIVGHNKEGSEIEVAILVGTCNDTEYSKD